ncbi:MAG: cyclic nucleotide-binding domain-containing protein [Caldilineaceae bacterium]
MNEITAIATYLREVSLFRQLPAAALQTLVQQGELLTLAADAVVFWEGEASDAMYVIVAGEVRVFKRDEAGNEVEINHQKQGECFGELALLDSRPRSASIACLTACQLFKLEKRAFMNLLVQPATQSAAFSILSLLVERVRVITEKYFDEQLAQRVLQAEMEAERHRALAQLVAGVAHELNTPLGITNTAVDMIAKRVQQQKLAAAVQDNPGAQAVLAQMQEAAILARRNIERAHKLVENFKKISVNQLTVDRETMDLPTLVADIVELFKLNARQAQLQVVIHNDLPADQQLWTGYSGLLTQVLTNLLFNIERYAYPDQQGGRIAIGLRLAEQRKLPTFVLTVQDYGAGIAPADLPQIFTPFFTTGRSKGGTGLGLAIVHNIVTEALHGTIKVESKLGAGACFTITFPQEIE